MKYWIFKLLELVFKVIKWFFIAVICITVLGLLMQYATGAGRFEYLSHILAADREIDKFVHYYVPTHFWGKDISRFITLIAAFIGLSITSNFEYNYGYKARVDQLTQKDKGLTRLRETEEGAKKLAVLDEKMQKIQTATSRKDREALLQEFVAIKKQLETMGRNLAFLSVDVVDSTGMKNAEEPLVVANDFAEYHKFAESKLNAYGCIKSTWTPDGLMACFNTVEEAVKAAQSMIHGLKEFNHSEKKAMKRDFVIRCGINAGYLLFDETLPLEAISDRVIDIAGHMQKYAKPNTIFLAKNIIKPIQSPDKFSSASKVVDDLDVYEWQPGDGVGDRKQEK